jgi:hypothetical protein
MNSHGRSSKINGHYCSPITILSETSQDVELNRKRKRLSLITIFRNFTDGCAPGALMPSINAQH